LDEVGIAFALFSQQSRDNFTGYRINDHESLLHHPLESNETLAHSFPQTFFRPLPLKRLPRPSRRSSLSNFIPKMAHRDVGPSRHSYTGGHFRQRLKNRVVTYVDAKVAAVKGVEPGTARSVEDPVAEEEKNNKDDAKDMANIPGEEKLVLFPTYAMVKPHLFHGMHQHASTSEHGIKMYG
jgi:hypothetical protein